MSNREVTPWLILLVGCAAYTGFAAAKDWAITGGVCGAAAILIAMYIALEAHE